MATRRRKQPRARSILLSRKHRAKAPDVSLSSKASRAVISRHHGLQKRLAQALAQNDLKTADSLKAEIDINGGLEWYQHASIVGQSDERGGDSSKILMDWIKDMPPQLNKKTEPVPPLRLLEVGALTMDNACSKSAMFSVTRIDLHSRHPGILSQDFMERPIPAHEEEEEEEEKFDIISLSLVLNYVPSPPQRGEMLRRTTDFLRRTNLQDSRLSDLFPSLFLVLPAPCVTNSRYLDDQRLTNIMESLGYSRCRQKLTNRILYQLWVFHGQPGHNRICTTKFKKEEVKGGKNRNNFAIVLE